MFRYGGATFPVMTHIHAGGGHNTMVLAGGDAPGDPRGTGTTKVGDIQQVTDWVVTDVKAGQQREIDFFHGYKHTGVFTIHTEENYDAHKLGAIAGSIVVDGSVLTKSAQLVVTGGNGAGHDILELDKKWFSSFAETLSHAAQTGHDTVIRLDANDSILLHGVQKSWLVASDFHFL